MTEQPIFPSNKNKKKFPVVRVSKELKQELDEIKNNVFPFQTTYNKVLSLLPRCPNCGALVLKLEKDDTLTCWKCGRKYVLTEVKG